MNSRDNYRILLIDDMVSIHDDFRKILIPNHPSPEKHLQDLSADLFGTNPEASAKLPPFEIDSAYQGEEGIKLVQQSLIDKKPYALAFVDVQMPPGMDGIETIMKIWELDNDIQIVICTAYAKYTWEDILERFGDTDRLFILKKPFDNIEIMQLACSLTKKWNLHQFVTGTLMEFQKLVRSPDPRKGLKEAVNAFKDAVESLAAVNKSLKKLWSQL